MSIVSKIPFLVDRQGCEAFFLSLKHALILTHTNTCKHSCTSNGKLNASCFILKLGHCKRNSILCGTFVYLLLPWLEDHYPSIFLDLGFIFVLHWLSSLH